MAQGFQAGGDGCRRHSSAVVKFYAGAQTKLPPPVLGIVLPRDRQRGLRPAERIEPRQSVIHQRHELDRPFGRIRKSDGVVNFGDDCPAVPRPGLRAGERRENARAGDHADCSGAIDCKQCPG